MRSAARSVTVITSSTSTEPLNTVQPRLPARQYGTRPRFDRDDTNVRVAFLEHASDAGERASGAHAHDERVDLAGRCLPDLLGRGLRVDVWIGGIFELTAHQRIGRRLHQALRLLDGAGHAVLRTGQHHLGTVRLQQVTASRAHVLGHHDDTPISANGTDHRETDAGVAAGRLDDGRPRNELAGLFCREDHRKRRAVLHRTRHVVRFELPADLGAPVTGNSCEPYQRRVADQVQSAVVDSVCHVAGSIPGGG